MTGKDLILAVIGEIGVGGATNAALEFVGDGAQALSVDERLAVSNMAVEAGAETGLFPADDTVADYLDGRESRVRRRGRPSWSPTPTLSSRRQLAIDLDTLEPLDRAPASPGERRSGRGSRRSAGSTRCTSATAPTGR